MTSLVHVESVQVRSQASLRETVTEALDRLTTHNPLTRLLETPDRIEDGWVDAVNQSRGAAEGLFTRLLEDLRLMTGVNLRADVTIDLPILTTAPDGDAAQWVQSVAASFRMSLLRRATNILDGLRPRYGDFLVPISPVQMIRANRGPAIANFHRVSRDRRRQYSVTYQRAAVKPVDDFVRSIPPFVGRRLRTLERTHFDWKPAILDGVLVKEERDYVSRDHFKASSVFVAKVAHEVMHDPALVVTDGARQFVIESWKEGAAAETPFQRWKDRYAGMVTTASLLASSAACSVFVANDTRGYYISAALLFGLAGMFRVVVDFTYEHCSITVGKDTSH